MDAAQIESLIEHVERIRDLWSDTWDGRWSSRLYCRSAVPNLLLCIDHVLLLDAARSTVMPACAALKLYAAAGDDQAAIDTLTTIASRLSDRFEALLREEMSNAA